MTGGRLAPLLVALLCFTAIGVSATTLDSTLTTDPDDEIDLEYDRLPIGEEDAADVQDQLNGSTDPSSTRSDASEEGSGEETTPDTSTEERREGAASGSAGDDGSEGTAAGGDGDTGQGTGSGAGTRDLLDRLLALLAAILRVLVPLLVLAALLATAVRYRERIAALLGAILGDDEAPTAEAADPGEPWPPTEPANPVDRAWVALVAQVDPDRPALMTPAEVAEAARDAGLDADAVDAITRAFERVTYGGRPPSAEVDRARDGLRRLQGADGGTPHRSHVGDRPPGDERHDPSDRTASRAETRDGEGG